MSEASGGQERGREDVLDLLMSKVNDAVLTIDGHLIVDCNPAALKMLGRDREGIIGETPWALSPEFQPDGQRSSEKAKRVLADAQGGEPVLFEWLHEAPDGTKAWAEISLTRIEHNGDTRTLAILRDTTELRTVNEALSHQARFQRQKADILNELTSLAPARMAEGVRDVLGRIGELYAATRIFIWEREEGRDAYDIVFGWTAADASAGKAGEPAVYTPFDWVTRSLEKGETVYLHDIGKAPSYAKSLCDLLEKQGSRSFLAIPMFAEDGMFGASTIASDQIAPWDELAVDELETLSNILATCITRLRSTAAFEKHAALQARLASVSSQLLNARGDEILRAFEDTLALIGTDYELDRVSVGWFEVKHPSYGSPIDWAPKENPIQQVLPSEMPWGTAIVMAGKIHRIDDVDNLPPEAAIDQALTRKLGYKSALSIPLKYGDRVLGSITFATREQHSWSDSIVDELSLFASLISNTAVRQWSMAEIVQRERDLVRSQQVASVGSFSMTAVLDDDGVAEYRNLALSDEAKRIYDVEGQELDVRKISEHIHPDDEPRVRDMFRSLLRGEGSAELQYRVIRDNDEVRHVHVHAAIDEIDEQRVARGFGTVEDITDWVEANKKLEAALADVEALKDRLHEENVYLRDEVRAAQGFGEIIGNSRKLRNVLQLAGQVAPTDVTVLVTGETGTGKELVARAIHNQSQRSDRVMVSVNCAAIADELIESELFGHEKGAFTGAHAQRKGRFELANGGTLFLDEVGEMSGSLQSKLLRVIQEGEFERLGGSETLQTDVRIVAATNRDLMKEVDTGAFRADLYYRINSFPIHMPALRDRKTDIPLLVEHLVAKHATRLGKNIKSVSERMMRYLQRQTWPGNIRELESAVVRAIVTCNDTVLDYGGSPHDLDASAAPGQSDADDLAEVQRTHVLDVLERCGWKIEGRKGAACALGMPPSSLRSLMKRLDITRPTP